MGLFKQGKHLFKQWLPRERRLQIAARLFGFIVPLLHRTWRVTLENEERMETLVREHGAVILVTWHGRMLVPIACSQNRGYHALVSRSGDGEMLTAIFEKLGWQLIRGSPGRRAVEALRTGCEVLSKPGTVLAFTPDGPRGPSGVAKQGMIYFAQKTGKPIIPVGVSARPRHLLRSWDRFLIPLPFARCLWIYGDPIYVTPNDDLQEMTQRVQDAINALEEEAERRLGHQVMVAVKDEPNLPQLHSAP